MKPTITALTLAGLVATSAAYNRLINARLRRQHAPGATAWQVVAGTAYTLAAAIALIALWSSPRHAARSAIALAAAFIAAGAPMLLGDIRRDTD